MDRSLLNALQRVPHEQVLELGGSSGEFSAKALRRLRSLRSYDMVDIDPGNTNAELLVGLREAHRQVLSVHQADAQSLPFASESFDLTFGTCLLAHVSDPSRVLAEAMRVTRTGGAVVFLLPADPGVLNQVLKKLFTYPRMRKSGILHPDYIYAIGHLHPFHNLVARLRFELKNHCWSLHYRPFFLRSYHLNLWAIVSVEKR